MTLNWTKGFETAGIAALSVGLIASFVGSIDAESKKRRIALRIAWGAMFLIFFFLIGAAS